MKLSKSVAELQREHVVLELECIERMYLNEPPLIWRTRELKVK